LLTGKEGVAGGEEAGYVGHLAAGDEGEAGGRGEVKQVFEPGADNFFDDGGSGGAGVHSGVLVPGGGEPVGGESGGERAADDPSEEAGAGGVDDAAVDCFDEVIDYFGGVLSGVVEGKREVGSQGGEVCCCGYWKIGLRRQMMQGVLESCGKGRLKRLRLFCHRRRIVIVGRERTPFLAMRSVYLIDRLRGSSTPWIATGTLPLGRNGEFSNRWNGGVVADEDGQVVVLGLGPGLQRGDDVIGGGFGVEACAVF
jgi:hypothetical protein